MITNQDVASRMLCLREALGWGQGDMVAALKESLGWSQGTYSKIETGQRPIRLIEAVAITTALGVPLASLVGADDDVAVPQAGEAYRAAGYEQGYRDGIRTVAQLASERLGVGT